MKRLAVAGISVVMFGSLSGCASMAQRTLEESLTFRPFQGIFQSLRTENWYFDLNRPDFYKVAGYTVLGRTRYRLRTAGQATPNEVNLEMVCRDSVVHRLHARHLTEDSIRVTFETSEQLEPMTLVQRDLEPRIMRMLGGRSADLTPCSPEG